MCNLSWQVRGGLSEEVTFEQRLGEMEEQAVWMSRSARSSRRTQRKGRC